MQEKEETTSKLPCELVEDLLPLYIEDLTNPVTNELVEKHLKVCEECKQNYTKMKKPMPEEETPDVKEIDFLKKTKKQNRKRVIFAVAIIFVIALLAVEAKYFLIGNDINAEYMNYSLEVSGDTLHISGQTTAASGIRHVGITESEGVVKISVRAVEKSLFYSRSFEEDFQASQEIRQVLVGDQIVWADGEKISPITAELNANYNPYVGSMPQNGKLVSVLNMTGYMGNFQNKLQTTKEPYGWTMILANDFSANRKTEFEARLSAYAYVLLAEIENLGEITYEYTLDGKEQTLTITAADASDYAGEDIKSVGKEITALERLVQKTGLNQYALYTGNVGTNMQTETSGVSDTEEILGITVVNYATDQITGMGVRVETKNASGHQAMTNADRTPLVNGENVKFQLLPEDFDHDLQENEQADIRVTVTDENGNTYEAQGDCKVDLIFGSQYRINLSGNAKDGYVIGR